MDLYGFVWIYMNCMDFDNLLFNVDLYECVLIYRDSYGLALIYMDFYGFVCILLIYNDLC